MHWAEVIAEQLLQKQKHHVLATGITPSGPIHIGNMREILTTDAVYRCLKQKGADVDFIYIADDYDPLRRVYPFLPASYEQYVGKPVSEIPCPCGQHKSYADHYLNSFLGALHEIGVQPKVLRASEMYARGDFTDAVVTALENTTKIRTILETVSHREMPADWLPFNVKCQSCGRVSTTKPQLYEFPTIEYTCEACGHHGEVDVRMGGVGKLPWRVDWPARWKMLDITFEPCGKDHATVGGTRETGARIAEQIYQYQEPFNLVYEFILLKGMGAMHSSKGTAISAEEMLKMTPPEVLRFIIMRNQPNKHIVFDAGLGLITLVEDYDAEEAAYFGKTEETKGMKDLKQTYELSQPYQIPTTMPFHLPFRHLVTLVQIKPTWNEVRGILLRTHQIPTDLSKTDDDHLRQRADHARYWLQTFAPPEVKFELQQTLPTVTLTPEQRSFLETFHTQINQLDWTPDAIHNAIYDTSEKLKIPTKTSFQALYQILLGQNQGPRAGYFLSTLDKPFVTHRITEALKT
jgi:lysyl-tRNA synthetase, class I